MRVPALIAVGIAFLSAVAPSVGAITASGETGTGFFDAAMPAGFHGELTVSALNGIAFGRGFGLAIDLIASGESIVVERTSTTKTTVNHPAPGVLPVGPGNPVMSRNEDPTTEVTDFASATLAVTRSGAESTLLVHPTGDDAYVVNATSVGSFAVNATPGEEFRTHEKPVEAGAGSSRILYSLEYAYDVGHFRVDGSTFAIAVAGDFSLFLWDADFDVTDASGSQASFRTGVHADDAGALVTAEEEANAIVHVRNGTLSLQPVPVAAIAAPRLGAAIRGDVLLPRSVGGFATPSARYEANGVDAMLTGEFAASFVLVEQRFDRALVSMTGRVDHVSLESVKPLPEREFLGSPAAKATAASGAVLLVAGSTFLLVRNRDAIAMRVRPRGRRAIADAREAAVAALERGEDDAAAALFARALLGTPDDVVLLIGHGAVLERLGRFEKARENYERAIRLDPDRAECHYYYSRVLVALGLTTGAVPHLQRALLLDPRLRDMADHDPGLRPLLRDAAFVSVLR